MAAIRAFMIIIGLGLIGSAVGAVALAPKLEPFVREGMEAELGRVFGTQVKIEHLRPAWMEGALALEQVTIHNPPNFKDGPAAYCDRVLIQPEIFTVFSKSPTIASVTMEGTKLKLRYRPGDGTNLGYFKKQANTAAQTAATAGDGIQVKEVKAANAKIDLLPGPAFDVRLRELSLGALGVAASANISPSEAEGVAKTMAGVVNQVIEKGTTLQGMVQPLVNLLKLEAATNVAAAPAVPAPAAPSRAPDAKAPVVLDIPEI